jgi:hypothetical protein
VNFNIYLDSEMGAALRHLAKRRQLTRNALIRKAVLQWQGDAKFVPFYTVTARVEGCDCHGHYACSASHRSRR